MNPSPYGTTLIAGGFLIVGTLLGAWIGYLLSLQMITVRAKQEAISNLRASFAPQLAYLRGYSGSVEDIEIIREKLYSGFLSIHAAELEKFRFFIKSTDIENYDKACEKYEEQLHPNFIIIVKDKEPSEHFISQIYELLNFAK